MVGSLRISRRFRVVLASALVCTFTLSVSGCNSEGVGSLPKMKGKKDDMQKEGSGLPITPKKGKGKKS